MLRLRLAPMAALTLLLVAALMVPAAGYIQQRPTQVLLSGPNVVRCDRGARIEATVVATKSRRPIARQIVHWSIAQRQDASDGLSSTTTITNDKGKTSVRISFGPARGTRVIQAEAGGGAPRITVRCTGALPQTSAVPPDGHVEAPPAMVLAPPTTPDVAPATLPATAIRMDRLGIDLPLLEGDGEDVAEGAAYHYAGTAWPGEGSNMYVYAHAREGHFAELWRVRRGDRVAVDMADGSVAEYEVSEIHPVVPWDALEYLAPTDEEVITLQTCLTYEETAPRFVVIARRITSA